MKTIMDIGNNDRRIVLEEEGKQIFVTNNAVTRRRVHYSDFRGPGWDNLNPLDFAQELMNEGWPREVAVAFVRRALWPRACGLREHHVTPYAGLRSGK